MSDTTDTRKFIIFGEHAANIMGYSESEIGAMYRKDKALYKSVKQVCGGSDAKFARFALVHLHGLFLKITFGIGSGG